MEQKLFINTVTTVHQRTYVGILTFASDTYGRAWKWLHPALKAMAVRSTLVPIPRTQAMLVKQGLEAMMGLPEWDEVTGEYSPDSLYADSVRILFARFEQKLLERKTALDQASRCSRFTRKFVLTSLREHGQAAAAARVQKLFRSQIPYVASSGRPLISDMPMPGRAPLAAISFQTHAELKQATTKVLQQDLEKILEGCTEVLDRFDRALATLNQIKAVKVTVREKIRLIAKPIGSSPSRARKAIATWSSNDMEKYLALMLQGEISPGENPNGPRYPAGLKKHLRSRLDGISNGANVHDLLQLDVAFPAEVLLACALIIQIHTHWNYISVLELTVDAAQITGFPHRLQSVKPKTSDETPPVFVERSDCRVIRALNMLVERWHRLVVAGVIRDSRRDLWFSSRAVMSGKEPWPVVAWASELREFTRKYKLPSFSLEQVRVQCLATVVVGDRGLGGVMQSAGHTGLATSLRYVDKLLLRRLNAANTQEFERRLEKTILYMMGKDVSGERLIAYPLGDGTSCRAPEKPPLESWIDGGVCKAEKCHFGDGCPNRLILITEDRIEEVIRTKNYYLSNWKRLADENNVRFEQVHLPHMLFCLGLFGVLKRGPYRHLVSSHEARHS